MPASNRQRRIGRRVAVAAAAGGLLAMAAPITAATAAPPVTITVTSTGTDAPTYQIDVRNDSGATVTTTVRQELPPAAAPISISDGGRTATPAGQNAGTEVSWNLQLIAGGAATVRTQLAKPPSNTPVTAPACAFAGDGDLPYDCASATWQPAQVVSAAPAAPPWWRRPAVLLAAAGALLLLLVLGAGAWWWRRRRAARAAAERAAASQATADQLAAGARPGTTGGRRIGRPASGGAVYRAGQFGGPRLIRDEPPPALPGGGAAGGPSGPGGNLLGGWWRPTAPGPPRRSRPPTWLAVGLAALLAAGLALAVIGTASTQVDAISPHREPSSGAWIGRSVAGPVGAPLRDSVFEFTVYRLACPDTSPAPAATPPAASPPAASPTTPSSTATSPTAASPTAAAPAATSSTATSPAAAGAAPAGADPSPSGAGMAAHGSRCQVTVGLHNISGRDQFWDGSLQRAYLPGGDWVTADETATLAANAGRDYFAEPVPAGERMVFPLVFTLPGAIAPARVELRGEVFSAGVSVDVP